MTRSEQLDAMTEADKVADIERSLAEHGAVRLDRREQLAFWGAAVDRLVASGKATADHHENYEGQYSYILIEPT